VQYAPQTPAAKDDTLRAQTGQALTLHHGLGGQRSHHQWQRQDGAGQWQDVANATESTLRFTAVQAAEAGRYRTRATNDWVTDLTLYSPATQLQVTGEGQVPDRRELRALRALYDSTRGPQWSVRTGWPATSAAWDSATIARAASWYGVRVVAGDVVSLGLVANNLHGTLPDSLVQLRQLQSLNLAQNQLQGPLPARWADFPLLNYLQLNANQLSGTLRGVLEGWPSLSFANLDNNQFTGELPLLQQLPALRDFSATYNQLSGALPPGISKSTTLTGLTLTGNQFVGPIPQAWGRLQSLVQLVLNRNHLTGSLPDSLATLPSLTYLVVDHNQLSGTIPAAYQNQRSLYSLVLSYNQFTGALPYLPAVYVLVDHNQFGGEVPVAYASKGGGVLALDYNAFTLLPAFVPVDHPGLSITVADNLLAFNSFEPNQITPGRYQAWAAQRQLQEDTLQVAPNARVELNGQIGGAHNVYQWQRLVAGQWVDIPGQTQVLLSWAAVSPTQSGSYRTRVTNEWVVAVTLYSRSHYLDVTPYRALTRNLPVDKNLPESLGTGLSVPDANAPDPGDINFVRTWVPRVALTSTDVAPTAAPTTGTGGPNPSSPGPVTHLLRRAQWDNLASPSLSALPLTAAPSSVGYLLTSEGPTAQPANSGDRLSGWLTAPQTGDYVFALAASNQAELWLSSDADPAHQQRRATVPASTLPREFTRFGSQLSAPLPLVAGQRYYLEVRHAAQAGDNHLSVAWQRPGSSQLEVPLPNAVLDGPAPASGGLFRELWTNAYGTAITDVPLTTPPTRVDYLNSLEGPTNAGDQYGDRLRGYLLPPVSGAYTFGLAADDNAAFWLSTDEDPAHLVRQAQVSSGHATAGREWSKYAEQRSAPVSLVAGQRYYLEVVHKEGGGGDNLALGWQQPGESSIAGPIPGSALAPYLAPYTSPAPAPSTPTGGSTAAAEVPNWPLEQASQTTQYLDGLGRPIQTVRHQASPSHLDLVQPQAYDGLGRETQQFLPYAAAPAQSAANATTAQGFHYRALSEQQQFYSRTTPLNGGPGPLNPNDPIQGIARTNIAYSQTLFEESPLNRVVAQGAPGQQWQLTGGHIQQRQEQPNVLGMDSVLAFQPGYDPRSLNPGYQGLYAPGEVWGVQTTDEQGFVSIEWKDKLGQVVQKQVQTARVDTSGGSQLRRWLRTSYVYDDFGRLRFVLQPQATRALLAAVVEASLPPPNPDLQLWLPGGNPSGHVVRDLAGQHRDGTLIGGAWPAPGPAPTPALGITLQGSDRLAVPLNLPASAAFTLAFWVRPTQLKDNSCMLSARLGNGDADPWGTFAFHTSANGTVYAGINYWAPNGRIVTAPKEMREGEWQHFVFTYDQGTGTLYHDGRLVQTLTGMPAAPAWPGLLLGGVAGSQNYNGSVADLRRYQRALSAAEVQALAQRVVPTAPVLPAAALAGLQPYLFHYRYDGRGRQVAKQVPGTDGETLVVYDQLDRPVLSQDAQQRTRQEWSWTKYDALGRIILSGLTTRQDTMSQVSLQAVATADTATAHQYEQRTADQVAFLQHYTTTQSFPQLGQRGFGAGQVLNATYYDDYNFDNDIQGLADASYDASTDARFPTGAAPIVDVLRTQDMTTRTLTRVLSVAENDPAQAAWLTTTTFYDERARPVQVQTTNARKGLDLLTTQLDFTGKVVQSVAVHQGPNHLPVPVVESFTYDHTGRLLTTRQQLPGEARALLLDSVQYNEIGQATRKTLATGRLQQNVDYAYNIRGWLTRLNDPYQPDGQDLFNLSLHYEQGFTRGYEQYNGNLTGQTWRGRDGVQRAYGYVYDPLSRLLQGDFVARAGVSQGTLTTATLWNQEKDNYRLSFVSYDDNGNINTLRRQGLLKNATHATSKQYGAVDNLTYAYVGNRLQAVDDAVTGNQLPKPATYHGAPTSLAGDFQEAGVHRSQEYVYDANGNLLQDLNKGITGIRYNHLNLPQQIHLGPVGDSIVFRYAASGQKVAKLVYQTGKPLLRTDYLGPYQYEQDSLKFFPHAEGRVLRFVSTDPSGQPTVSYQREFTFKDHLGNLRLAYRLGQVRTYVATLEQTAYTHRRESQQFASLSVSEPIAVQTSYTHGAGSWAARLNARSAGGGAPQPLGPLTQLAVQKGDKLSVTAPGLYPQQVGSSSFGFSLLSFVTGLLQPPPAGTPTGLDGSRRGGLPLLQIGLGAGLAALPQLSGGVPKGYLRVLVFNQDSALVDQRTVQLTQAALGSYQELHLDSLAIQQDGYVTVYVGNESPVDVYFDDVTIQHRQGLQVQENQYDPYGLDLAGISGAAPGLRLKNFYQFNGKENQLDLGLNWNHHDWRFLDYQLGRWHAVDPMIEDGQEHWTPYQFGFDNAVRFNDPDGQNPFLIAAAAGAAIGAVVGGGIEAGTQMYRNGGHVSDWHAVGGAAIQGGVTGGMAGLTGGTSLLRSGAVGAVSNVAGGIARNVYDGKPVTVGSVAKDAAIGAAAGIAGHAASKAVGAIASRVKGGVAAEAETAGSIRSVNNVGGTQNCVNCAIATDATLAGRPASALGTTGVQPIAALEKEFGAKFTHGVGIKQIEAAVGQPGQRGIVFGIPTKGGDNHVFNVVNQKGVIRFLDGQTGKVADITRYKFLSFLPTNK